MNEHFLKLHFVCLKNHKGCIMAWIIIIFLEYFSLIAKFICLKLDTYQKCFCMFKSFKLGGWTIFIFSKRFFFLPNVHHSFWKLERILTLMIIIFKKGLELMIFFYITNLSTFEPNVFLTLKIMNSENVVLAKVVHINVIKGMNAYYII